MNKNQNNLLSLYMRDISGFKLLRKDEEQKIGEKINNKKDLIMNRNKLVVHNFRLVVYIANHYIDHRDIFFMDLITAGNDGLMDAAEKFDIKKRCRFSTYAWDRISASILKFIKDDVYENVRLPIHTQEDIKKIKNSVYKLKQNFGRNPDIKEISSNLGISEKKIKKTLQIMRRKAVNLDGLIKEEGKNKFGDIVADDRQLTPLQMLEAKDELRIVHQEIKRVLIKKSTRNREIFCLRYGLNKEGRTFKVKKLSEKYKISVTRIGQILSSNSNKKICSKKNFEQKIKKLKELQEIIGVEIDFDFQ